LTSVQFADSYEIKTRPAVVLFEDFGNVIIAGITSNTNMQGIKLEKKDGVVKDSVIKTNYIFTVSELMIKKRLFSLRKEKKQELYDDLTSRFSGLRN
jgi:mRNA interferase MazF